MKAEMGRQGRESVNATDGRSAVQLTASLTQLKWATTSFRGLSQGRSSMKAQTYGGMAQFESSMVEVCLLQ